MEAAAAGGELVQLLGVVHGEHGEQAALLEENRVLKAKLGRSPIVLALEDVQWMDDSWWKLLTEVMAQARRTADYRLQIIKPKQD